MQVPLPPSSAPDGAKGLLSVVGGADHRPALQRVSAPSTWGPFHQAQVSQQAALMQKVQHEVRGAAECCNLVLCWADLPTGQSMVPGAVAVLHGEGLQKSCSAVLPFDRWWPQICALTSWRHAVLAPPALPLHAHLQHCIYTLWRNAA